MIDLSVLRNLIDRLILIAFEKAPVRLMKHMCWLLHTRPALSDRWGYTIRQFHYYDPLPKFSDIKPEQVYKRRESACIDWHWDAQLALLKNLSQYCVEIEKIASSTPVEFDFFNNVYSELDAAIYYAMLRHIKPVKVIEVGSGYSTQIASLALRMNRQAGKAGKITCIEPFPVPILTDANLDIELVTERIEVIELEFFKQLKPGDVLFIDSTHTVKFGSDVCREILEILPAISSNVWVHFHDIFYPYDYPADWLIKERRAWNEQYMLEAFLAYNSGFEVVLVNNWLAIDYPQEVAKIWPGASKWQTPYHQCGGLWLRKK
jgi:hypothetical protein